MKFGYVLLNFGDKVGATELLEIARVCEAEGFDSVWATDHIVMPRELREPYGQVLEPLVTLAAVAAKTSAIRLGTSALIVAQRNPVLAAKQVATLDAFSKGRVTLAMGAGWAEKEFGYLNSDFTRRGRVFDESVNLMRALWSQDFVDFEGEFFRVKDAIFLPKPVQKSLPVWIAGNGPTAVNRAIRLGDGWHPSSATLETFKKGADMIKSSGNEITISLRITADLRKKRTEGVSVSGSTSEVKEGIEGYGDAGLQYCCISILHKSSSEIIADLRTFAKEILRSY